MNQNTTNEIDLKDLFIYWALHFRSAFILCICVFIISGAYKGYCVSLEKSREVAEATEDKENAQDTSMVTTYQVVVSNDPNFDASTSPKTYITVAGKDAATGQGIANAIIQSRKDDGTENVVYEINVRSEGQAGTEAIVEKPSQVFVKYGTIGAVAMLFLHLLFFALKYVLSTAVITSAQQHDILGIPVLARKRDAMSALYKNKCGISCTLRRIGGLSPEESNIENIADMAAVNLKLLVKKVNQVDNEKECSGILIAGQATMADKREIADALAKRMKDITFTVAESLDKNSRDREELLKCEGVLFVEVYGQTMKKIALEEQALALSVGKTVLGSVWS